MYKGTVESQLGGYEVAVKIQRPGSLELVTLDLFLLRAAAPYLRNNLGLNTDLVGLVDEWVSFQTKHKATEYSWGYFT